MGNQQTPEGKTAEQICNENPYSDGFHVPEAYACVIAKMYSEQYKSKLLHHQEANAKLVEALRDIATGRIDAIGIAKEALNPYTHE